MTTPALQERAAPPPPPAPPAPAPHLTPFAVAADPLLWPQTPKPVADNLRLLRRERDDLRATWRAVSDEQRAARDVRQQAQLRLKAITKTDDDPIWKTYEHAPLEPDHPEVVAVTKRLADANAEIDRLEPIVAARATALEQSGQLLATVESYFTERLIGLGKIQVYDGARPTPRKGEGPLDAIERCRRRVRELDADRHRVTSAPWHSDHAKQRARAAVETIAARGAPSVLPLIESADGTVAWRERPFAEQMIGGRVLLHEYDPGALPILFWLHREAIIKKIEEAIDAAADDAHALTMDQRRVKLAEIDRDRLAAARDEEFFLTAAVAAGATILRRANADPRAVLGIGDDAPAPSSVC